MKNTKKIVALVMSMTIVASFAACSEEGNTDLAVSTVATEITTPKELDDEDKQAVEEIEVENATLLENPVVRWLSFWDLNPAKGKTKSVTLELFETKYGGQIEMIPTTFDTRYNDLSTLVLGGESPDMFPGGDQDTFPSKPIAGMLQPWDDYIDFENELFPTGAQQLNEDHVIGGKHYLAVTGTDVGNMIIYNKKVIEENSLPDPAELLAEGNWTWDTMRDMMFEFSDKDQDKYGYDGWWFETSFFLTTGVPAISMNDSVLTSNITSPEMERAQNFMYDLRMNDVNPPLAERNWSVFPNYIGEGKTLFYPTGIWALYETDISAFGKQGEIMFVPMPKDPAADAHYLPTGMVAFALAKGAPNPEGAAAYIECELIAQQDEKAKEISRNLAVEDYGWTEEMLAMQDTIQELTNANPVVDMYTGSSSNIYQLVHEPIKSSVYTAAEWSTTRDTIAAPIEAELADINAKIQLLIEENS